jgi:hypothetical protein
VTEVSTDSGTERRAHYELYTQVLNRGGKGVRSPADGL